MSRIRSIALGAIVTCVVLPAGASAATGSAGQVQCKFPLVGTLPITFQTEVASSDVVWGANTALPPYVLSLWTTEQDFSVLETAGIASFKGAGDFDLGVGRYNFIDETQQSAHVDLNVRERPVTEFRATGILPPFVLDKADWYGFHTRDLHFNLVAENSAGTVLTLPPLTTDVAGNPVTDSDGDPSTFDVYCGTDPQSALSFGVLQITDDPDWPAPVYPTPDPQPAPGTTTDTDPPYGVNWNHYSDAKIGPDFIDVAFGSGVDEPGGSGLKGYVIFVNGQRREVGFPTFSTTLDSLTPDTNYDVVIYAVDNAGNWSLPVFRRFHTLKAGAAPVAVPTPKPVPATFPTPTPVRTPGPGETPFPGGPTATPLVPTRTPVPGNPTPTATPKPNGPTPTPVPTLTPGAPTPSPAPGGPTPTPLPPTATPIIKITPSPGPGTPTPKPTTTPVATVTPKPGTTPVATVTPKPSTTPVPTLAPTPIPTLTPKPSPSAKYSYLLQGSTTLNTLTKGSMPLTGRVDAQLALATGDVTAALTLNDTQGRLTALGFLPVTATVGFVSSGPTTGKLIDDQLTTNSKVRIKVKSVKAFGAIPLAGGNDCQTKSLSEINLTSVGSFDPTRTGGTLAGTYAISDLNGCGPLNGLVSPLTAGSGNALRLSMTPTTT